METKTKATGLAVTLFAIILGSTVVLTPTGTTDRCVRGGVYGEWMETSQPFLYYCAPEDKYQWCLGISDWGGNKNVVCQVAEINQTIPPQNITIAEWPVEPPNATRVLVNISCYINGEEVMIYLDEPDTDIDDDLEDALLRVVGNISMVKNCTITNSTVEELINVTYCRNFDGKRSFFRNRLEVFG